MKKIMLAIAVCFTLTQCKPQSKQLGDYLTKNYNVVSVDTIETRTVHVVCYTIKLNAPTDIDFLNIRITDELDLHEVPEGISLFTGTKEVTDYEWKCDNIIVRNQYTVDTLNSYAKVIITKK